MRNSPCFVEWRRLAATGMPCNVVAPARKFLSASFKCASISSYDWKRLAGSYAIARSTALHVCRLTHGADVCSGTTLRFASRKITVDMLSSSQGGLPANAWYTVAPKAYMSERKSSGWLSMVSGGT